MMLEPRKWIVCGLFMLDLFAIAMTSFLVEIPRHLYIPRAITRLRDKSLLPHCERDQCINERGDRLCNCDDECLMYGDCCPDKALQLLSSFEEGNLTFPTDLLPTRYMYRSFLGFPTLEFGCNVYPTIKEGSVVIEKIRMVSRCPASWRDPAISARCSKSMKREFYTHVMDIPVYSKTTKLFYANIFCAVCHSDANAIEEWKFVFRAQTYSRRFPWHSDDLTDRSQDETQPNIEDVFRFGHYIPGKLSWDYNLHLISDEYKWTEYWTIEALINNPESYARHVCEEDKNVIKECPKSWGHSAIDRTERGVIIALCSLFTNFIITRDNVLYKNAFCAGCHDVDLSQVQCDVRHPDFYSPHLPTASVLLDFTEKAEMVGKTKICEDNFIYDTVTFSCFQVSCDSFHVMDDEDNCNLKNTTAMFAIESNCWKVEHPQEEFIYHDTYIYHKLRRIVYTQGEFEVSNKSIWLCIETDGYLQNLWKFSHASGILTIVCSVSSLLCLAIHIFVTILCPELRNLPGKVLLCISGSLFGAQLLFLVGFAAQEIYWCCVAIGAMTHFCFLATFFWMKTMAYDICRTFVTFKVRTTATSQEERKRFLFYSAYSWTLPAFIVVVSICLEFTTILPSVQPRYGAPLCWINSRFALGILFALPTGIVLMINVVFYGITANIIHKASKDTQLVRANKENKSRFFIYIKLATIMGLTWVFGFAAASTNVQELWYLFTLFNGLQGAFIFFAFTFKRKTWQMVTQRFGFVKAKVITSDTQETIESKVETSNI